MKAKRLSLFLALVMVLSAFAGTFTVTFAAATDKPFKIGDTTYENYAQLPKTVTADTTVQVVGDYSLPSNGRSDTTKTQTGAWALNPTVASGVTLTLEGVDVGGSYPTLTFNQYNIIHAASSAGTIVFKNLNIQCSSTESAMQCNAATFVFENVTFDFSHTNNGILSGSKSMTFKNCTVAQKGATALFTTHNANFTVSMENSTFLVRSLAHLLNANSTINITADATSKIVASTIISNPEAKEGCNLKLNGKSLWNLTAGTLQNGATVRMNTELLEDSGLRFTSTFTKDQLDAAADVTEDVSYGTIIFKTDDVSKAGTFYQLIDAAKVSNTDSLQVLEVPAVEGKTTDEDGNVTVRAAMVNIKKAHYEVLFGAVSYLQMDFENGSSLRLYSNYKACTVKQIAEAALKDYKTYAHIADNNGSYLFDDRNYANDTILPVFGKPTKVFTYYADAQIDILKIYAGIE